MSHTMVAQFALQKAVYSKVTWGNSVNGGNSIKMTSNSYNFTSTLVIEMYLYRQARCLLYTEYHASALNRGDSSLL